METKSQKRSVQGETKVNIDLATMYGFDQDKMVPDITTTAYSNLAYIQLSNRDVYIDFLQIPGIKKDDKFLVGGVRVYMSFSAAEKLAEVLDKLLKETYEKGRMDQYPSSEVRGTHKK